MKSSDIKLIWEAYKGLYIESPDNVKDSDQNSIFYWNSKSQLTSTFMRIGNQWFVAGVNIFKGQPKSGKDIMIHDSLFAEIIEAEIMKVLPQQLERFDYATAYESGNAVAVFNFIKRVFKTSQILTAILKEYTKHGEEEEFLREIAEEISYYTNPEISEFRASKGFKAFSLVAIFYVTDESDTRAWFDCGRLWIDPKAKGYTIPGLVISMWKTPNTQNKGRIQEELSRILKDEGYNFTRITWDGDSDIDPYQKHIRASKLSAAKQPTWDDIKYR